MKDRSKVHHQNQILPTDGLSQDNPLMQPLPLQAESVGQPFLPQENEQLQLEYTTLLEEYKVLKSEIANALGAARQVSNLTLTALAAVIASIPFLREINQPVILLLLPFLFYALAWTQLRYIFHVLDMGRYLNNTTASNIRRIIRAVAPANGNDLEDLLAWDKPGNSPSRLRIVLFLPIAGANYGIPLVAASGSVIAFMLTNQQGFSALEAMLLGGNILALVYSVYWGLQAEAQR